MLQFFKTLLKPNKGVMTSLKGKTDANVPAYEKVLCVSKNGGVIIGYLVYDKTNQTFSAYNGKVIFNHITRYITLNDFTSLK